MENENLAKSHEKVMDFLTFTNVSLDLLLTLLTHSPPSCKYFTSKK